MMSMKRLFKNIDAVLFDLDGTLVETNIDFTLMRNEMRRMAAEASVSKPDLANMDIIGIVDYVYSALDKADGDRFRERAFQVLEEIELRHSKDTKEIDYAHELLDALRKRGARIGVVTRNCRTASQMSLQLTGLSPDLLVSRDDVRKTKPHPEHLLIALKHFNISPERSIMIGDHPMDITAGKAAGMRTIGLLTAGQESNFFKNASPDAVAQNLKEILDAVIDSNS